MIFVDTNFFLRYLLKDIPHQYNESEVLFLQAAYGEINLLTSTIVIFEIEWVLSDYYGLSKTKAVSSLEKILELKIYLDEKELISEALAFYRNQNLDLEDCYNLIFAKQRKVKEFKTFDKKLLKVFKTKSLSSQATLIS